jgi:hypothetical protein
MVKYLSFHNSSFALRYFFNVNGKATVVTHPFVSIGSLSTSHRAERESQWKEEGGKEGRKEGRKEEEEETTKE